MKQKQRNTVVDPSYCIHNKAMSLILENVMCTRKDFQLHLDCSFQSKCITTIVGKSGAGKTSLLYAIAGFLPLQYGRIIHNDLEIHTQKLENRNLGFVFQDYALFPHLSVFENIAYGLRARKCTQQDIDATVQHLLNRCELEDFSNRAVNSLSGGQQQRVAIARALAYRPSILLCDEALGALEKDMRLKMQEVLREYVLQHDVILLYVTHNREEALSLGDDVLGLEDGRILMHGNTRSLYYHPPTLAAAALLGEYNVISARLRAQKDQMLLFEHACWGRFTCCAPADTKILKDTIVQLIVRLEHIRLSTEDGEELKETNGLHTAVRVRTQRFYGLYWVFDLEAAHAPANTRIQAIAHSPLASDSCVLDIAPDCIIPVFDAMRA